VKKEKYKTKYSTGNFDGLYGDRQNHIWLSYGKYKNNKINIFECDL